VSAILAVTNGEIGFTTVDKLRNVPKSTFQRYANDTSLNPKDAVSTALEHRETEGSIFTY
jgi:hypothetical protein